MPYVIRPPVRKMSLALAFAAAVICSVLVPTFAQADDDDGGSYGSYESRCPDISVSTPFSIFGDLSDYALVDGGDFESGVESWSLSRASVVSGNESYYVGGTGHGKALSIQPFGKATSSRLCVDYRYPHFRFFARHTDGPFGLLIVRARWTEGDDTEYATLGLLGSSGYASWSPTNLLPLAERLSLTDRNGTQHIRLVFTPLAGTWEIDDVYVDPYRR